MVKDFILRILFTPALGVIISFVSGIISYYRYTGFETFLAICFFVFVSYCTWKGCHWLHLKMRRLYPININPFTKIFSLCIISSIYGAATGCVLCLIWMKISREVFSWVPILKFIVFSDVTVILFTLIYEVMYLSKERERDNIIVDQLDNELTKAEIAALRNELDPHFIFNSLNTLSFLITSDSKKADLFNHRLAQVYKYFLINKSKDQIPLEQEIDFIKDYIFLIEIRHENKLQISLDIDENEVKNIMVIPYSLQLLIENAIKHNDFSNTNPLEILISIDNEFLSVRNSIKKRHSPASSTNIGLRNLSAQYLLIFKKHIVIDKSERRFLVKLPLMKKRLND